MLLLPGAPPEYSQQDQDVLRATIQETILRLERKPNIAFISGDRGDTDVTLEAEVDLEIQRFATNLTVNRVVTLGAGFDGAKFRILRTGLGAGTLDVGGLKTIPAATAATVDVGHTGTGWILTGYGVL